MGELYRICGHRRWPAMGTMCLLTTNRHMSKGLTPGLTGSWRIGSSVVHIPVRSPIGKSATMSKTQGVLTPGGVVRVLSLAAAMAGGATATATAQMSPPRGLEITTTGPSSVHMTWRAAPAFWFQVSRYRAAAPDVVEATSGKLPGTTMQWDDAGLVAGVAYQYVIEAQYPNVKDPYRALPTPFTISLGNITLAKDFAAPRLGANPPRSAPPPSQPATTPPTTTTPAYALPPSSSATSGFRGMQVSSGTVQLTWRPVNDAQGYKVRGPSLPAEGQATQDTSLVISGLPVGTHLFLLLASGSSALYQSVAVTVQ